MKKLLLSCAAVLMTLGAWADTVTFDFVPADDNPYNWKALDKDKDGYINESARPVKCVEAPVTMSIDGKFRRMVQRVLAGEDCLLLYKNASMTFTSATGYTMEAIRIYSAKDKIADLYVKEGSGSIDEQEETGETYTHSEDPTRVIAQVFRSYTCHTAGPVVIADAANGGTQIITKIEVDYEANTKTPAGLEWSTRDFTAYIGADNAFPTLTKKTTASIDYSSDNEQVATIDAATGAITLVGPGTTVITAGCDADGAYDWGEAQYTLTVLRNNEVDATFDFTSVKLNDGSTTEGTCKNFPDIPFNSAKAVWWTTNPNDKDSYAAGTQFRPLELAIDDATAIITSSGTKHGNVRLTLTNKIYNMQLGGGSILTVKPAKADATLYDVVVSIIPSKFEASTGDNAKTNDAGTLSADSEASTLTWTPKAEGEKEAWIDFEGGAYITSIKVAIKEGASTPTTGIEAIDSDENAPVEYYNLQGIRVANPSNGIFIRRQGANVTKVLVK